MGYASLVLSVILKSVEDPGAKSLRTAGLEFSHASCNLALSSEPSGLLQFLVLMPLPSTSLPAAALPLKSASWDHRFCTRASSLPSSTIGRAPGGAVKRQRRVESLHTALEGMLVPGVFLTSPSCCTSSLPPLLRCHSVHQADVQSAVDTDRSESYRLNTSQIKTKVCFRNIII